MILSQDSQTSYANIVEVAMQVTLLAISTGMSL